MKTNQITTVNFELTSGGDARFFVNGACVNKPEEAANIAFKAMKAAGTNVVFVQGTAQEFFSEYPLTCELFVGVEKLRNPINESAVGKVYYKYGVPYVDIIDQSHYDELCDLEDALRMAEKKLLPFDTLFTFIEEMIESGDGYITRKDVALLNKRINAAMKAV